MPEPAAIMVPVASLVPWPGNPRHNDGAPVEAVVDSIRRFGFGAPVLARRETGEIIAGHTRVKAAQALGMTEVPVRYMDLDENEAHALAIADNRVGELATWDDEGLASVLTELRDAGTEIGGLGWDEAGLNAILSPDRAPDSGNHTSDSILPPGMQYRVLVKVADEEAQVSLIERLEVEGYACQPLIS